MVIYRAAPYWLQKFQTAPQVPDTLIWFSSPHIQAKQSRAKRVIGLYKFYATDLKSSYVFRRKKICFCCLRSYQGRENRSGVSVRVCLEVEVGGRLGQRQKGSLEFQTFCIADLLFRMDSIK